MLSDISLHKTSLQGYRVANEDSEKYNINLSINGNPINPNYAPIDLFIICDGHGGHKVAEYVTNELERILMKKCLKYPLKHSYIIKIFDYIQKKLINNKEGIAKTCGCTALILIRYMDNNMNKNIQVINLGDCRAVLSRKGLAMPLSKDHKPYWPDEKKRIDNVNNKYGTNRQIHFADGDWRIGDLSVSRSFGDIDNTPYVSHIPDSFCYQLMNDDEFIIMACDGLWDIVQNHDAVNFIRDHYNNNHIEFYNIPGRYPMEINNDNIARKLAQYAIINGSTDNVSVIIIFFEKIK